MVGRLSAQGSVHFGGRSLGPQMRPSNVTTAGSIASLTSSKRKALAGTSSRKRKRVYRDAVAVWGQCTGMRPKLGIVAFSNSPSQPVDRSV